MVAAHGGDYSRDARRYNHLVTAIRQSTVKLQQIGRDERASPDETLRSLLEELVEALNAESPSSPNMRLRATAKTDWRSCR